MSPSRRYLLAFAAGALVGAGGVEAVRVVRSWPGSEQVTLTSLSPDDAVRVNVVELPHFVDRNFDLRLEKFVNRAGKAEVVFTSPDEGAPPGSERRRSGSAGTSS